MTHAAKVLRGIDAEEVAPLIAREDDVDYPDDDIARVKESTLYAQDTVEDLKTKILALNDEIERFLERYSVAPGSGSSSEPLTKWFVWGCAQSWHSLIGEWVRKEDTVGFRQFLVASWTDLKFPPPTERDGAPKPLDDHFRDRLAKSDIFLHFRGN
jgi:uncharacterized protein YdcH (DUF465 family)